MKLARLIKRWRERRFRSRAMSTHETSDDEDESDGNGNDDVFVTSDSRMTHSHAPKGLALFLEVQRLRSHRQDVQQRHNKQRQQQHQMQERMSPHILLSTRPRTPYPFIASDAARRQQQQQQLGQLLQYLQNATTPTATVPPLRPLTPYPGSAWQKLRQQRVAKLQGRRRLATIYSGGTPNSRASLTTRFPLYPAIQEQKKSRRSLQSEELHLAILSLAKKQTPRSRPLTPYPMQRCKREHPSGLHAQKPQLGQLSEILQKLRPPTPFPERTRAPQEEKRVTRNTLYNIAECA